MRAPLAALLLFLAFRASAIDLPPERERWSVIRLEGFTILGNAGGRELREVAVRTLRLRDALASITRLQVRSPLPTTVYVLGDEASFAPYRDAVNGRVAENTAGIFLPRRDGNYVVMVAGSPEAARQVIQHELTHHFLEDTIPAAPLWFSEGLAELYSTFESGANGVHVGLPRRDHLALLRHAMLLPLRDLFAVGLQSREYTEGSRRDLFYAESWALVHMLVIGDAARRPQLQSFLSALAEGRAADDAFHAAFDVTPEVMERELRGYVRRGTMTVARFGATEIPETEPPSAEVLPRDELLAVLGDLLAHGTPASRTQAGAFLREAVRLNPNHAAAVANLAFVAAQEGRRDESDALYARAVELGVPQWLPYAVTAEHLLNRVTPAEADVLKARALYARAVALNPAAVEAQAGLGGTYINASGDLTPGIRALETALRLDGRRVDAASDLAILYAHAGRRGDAMELVDGALLAGDPAARGRAREAVLKDDLRRALDLMRAGNNAGAIAQLVAIRAQTESGELRAHIDDVLLAAASDERARHIRSEVERAVTLANQRRWKEAVAVLDRIAPYIQDKALAAKVKQLRQSIAKTKK
jgi:tetratricopeptide (TPR) repeat protein